MSEKEFDFTKKKRVVVKIGSSSLNRGETGNLNFTKLEHLVRELCDMRNRGMDVCLVSSGAIAVGRQTIGLNERPKDISTKQACAAVGQARLMMTYQRMFAEYNQIAGQILMTKNTMVNPVSRKNAKNTFEELFRLGVIPIVNENDTVSTYEMQFGDNEVEEERRMFYVGMTRAKKKLHLYSIEQLNHKNTDISRFIRESQKK
jgi:glutamate 5-kinase